MIFLCFPYKQHLAHISRERYCICNSVMSTVSNSLHVHYIHSLECILCMYVCALKLETKKELKKKIGKPPVEGL